MVLPLDIAGFLKNLIATLGCASDSNGLPIKYVYLTFTVANIKGCNLESMTYKEYSTHPI